MKAKEPTYFWDGIPLAVYLKVGSLDNLHEDTIKVSSPEGFVGIWIREQRGGTSQVRIHEMFYLHLQQS